MKLLTEILGEILKSRHFSDETYDGRINNAWTDNGPLPSQIINAINKRIKFLEDVNFNIPNTGLGVKIFTSTEKVYYDDYPEVSNDWGNDLWLIIKGNKIITTYWKPSDLQPRAEMFIDFKDLKEVITKKNIGGNRNPVTFDLLF